MNNFLLGNVVAILGKENTGKSTLFNRLIQQNLSIISDLAGTTRDYIIEICKWKTNEFFLIDTGGIKYQDINDIHKNIQLQIDFVLSCANLVIILFDNRTFDASDIQIIKFLLKNKKKIILVANKVDNNEDINSGITNFNNIPIIGISAVHNKNISLLLKLVVDNLGNNDGIIVDNKIINFMMIGLTNSGKSTFNNVLLNKNRSITSFKKNTTRDLIQMSFEYKKYKLNIIDSPGINIIKKKYFNSLEKIINLGYIKTFQYARYCDLLLLVIDLTKKIDKNLYRIINFIKKNNFNVLVIWNKYDLYSLNKEKYLYNLRTVRGLNDYNQILISAKTKYNIQKVLPKIIEIYEYSKIEFSTPSLNKFAKFIQSKWQASYKNKTVKIFYICQKKNSRILSFILFINDKTLFNKIYSRYFRNSFKEYFPTLEFISFKIILKDKSRDYKN